MERAAYLSALIGRPWAVDGTGPDRFSCYGLFRLLQADLWSRPLPDVHVPADASRRWIMEMIARHGERQRWGEVEMPHGIITAADGAAVLMARLDRSAHIGAWLAGEGRIIHADDRIGVVVETPAEIRARGWGRLRFYHPASQD
ncbi:MAG: hypothetical protein B7Y77_00970 [Bradyrhizobium sp. 35-63-5]|nr:MAG: hypothetical protein B7Y77_00970 [Bradyrhizobium sp. 35-63-5]